MCRWHAALQTAHAHPSKRVQRGDGFSWRRHSDGAPQRSPFPFPLRNSTRRTTATSPLNSVPPLPTKKMHARNYRPDPFMCRHLPSCTTPSPTPTRVTAHLVAIPHHLLRGQRHAGLEVLWAPRACITCTVACHRTTASVIGKTCDMSRSTKVRVLSFSCVHGVAVARLARPHAQLVQPIPCAARDRRHPSRVATMTATLHTPPLAPL